MDKDARLSMLAGTVAALGDVPVITGFDAWRLASVKAEIEASIRTGKEVPYRLVQERQRLVRLMINEDQYDGPLMSRPSFQARAAERVNGLRASVESGDGGAVLEAVSVCLSHGLVAPGWLASAFVLRVERVTVGDSKDWSEPEVFGRAIPKGTNLAGVRASKQGARAAYEAAVALLIEDPSRPLDKGFYEAVGESVGYGATKAEELVREHAEQSSGAWPSLAALKPLLAQGHDPVEAVLMISNERDLKAWRAAGGTDSEWCGLIGRDADTEDAPGNLIAFPGLQK